jgi:DnaJ-class molecular chaperone
MGKTKAVKTNFNLPPGATLRNIDPPVCLCCMGHGEAPIVERNPEGDQEVWVECPECDGSGKQNERS